MTPRRLATLFLGLILLFPVTAAYFFTPTQGAGSLFAAPQFEAVWSRTDLPVQLGQVSRSWVWGPALPNGIPSEPFAGAPGGVRTVQYFDKARMEVNPDAEPTSQWATTTGLLVVEMVSGRVQTGANSYETRPPADHPVAGDNSATTSVFTSGPTYNSFRSVASLPGGPDHRVASATGSEVRGTIDKAGTVGALDKSDLHYSAYSQETGHNIPDVFDRFMQGHDLVQQNGALQQGSLLDPIYVLGYPITEAYWTTAQVDGKPLRVLVQLYQRRVLTYIPTFDAAWQVQMGNVGQHYYAWRYAPPPTPTATGRVGANDTFLHISGSQFYYAGSPVSLKGTNYWIHIYPPGLSTWEEWDGTLVRQELQKAHELGVNSVRAALPYNADVIWGDGCAEESAKCNVVKGAVVNRMTQLLQIASAYNMKVLFTLFDNSDNFPQAGTAEYNRQVAYMQALITSFVNDDRVIGWDLHNEPENYATWQNGGSRAVLSWLSNVAGVAKSLDTRHPITVGVANYASLWLDAAGIRLLDMVDFASFHCYNAGTLSAEIVAIKAHTGKPVLLEEMGWPTGPASLSRPTTVYDEATQQFLYRSMLKAAKDNLIAGVMQWMLQDNPLGTPTHYIKPTIQAWFGLVRLDNTFKPAAADFRDSYIVPPLPSNTRTSLLTTTPNGTFVP